MTPAAGTPSILVLGDSLSHYGPEGALPADHPQLWVNLTGAQLGLETDLIARIGWTARDAWWAVSQDPRLWSCLPRASVLVLAVGGMDSLPSPLPTALRETIRYVRPDWLRRGVRTVYQIAQKRLSGIGWPMALPPPVTVHYLETIREAVAAVRPGLPIVVMSPATHRSSAYNYHHPRFADTDTAIKKWAANSGVAVIEIGDLLEWSFDMGVNNTDGIHWGFPMHAAVADRAAAVITAAQGVRP